MTKRLSAAIGVLALTMGLTAACAQTLNRSSDMPFHHNADGTFRNLPGGQKSDAGVIESAAFFAKMLFDNTEVKNPPGHVLPADQVQLAALAAPNPSVTWLGHAAFIVRTGGKVILTDPFLGDVAGPTGLGPRRHAPPGMTVDELPDIDILLISHNHYDHLDRSTLKALKGKEQIEVIVPLGLAGMFHDMGYRRIHELDWWQERSFDRVTVRLLPAVHFSGRGIFDKNKSLWGSFGIYADDARIWFSGDTGYGSVFKEIGRRAGPFDMALVAIGAFEPRNFMKAVHASPEEAVKILKDVRADRGIGMHWGTIKLTLEEPFETPDRFRAAARSQGYGEENAIILAIGETHALPERIAQAVGE